MRYKNIYYYTLSDATGIIKMFDTKADLHRWLNETYPHKSEKVNSQGRKLVVSQLLPSAFMINKVRRDALV